jgi:enoyl-CoA hydratase/carnithine racemase
MSAHVEIATSDGIQVIRLVRPEKRNALTEDMYRALTDALVAAETDPSIRVRVLLGSGGHFSAGNDIAVFLASAKGEQGTPREVLRFIEALPLLRKPLIAGVDGQAVGIGTTLLMHCDLVYATPRATFATPFLDLGLVPEAASSLLMPAAMGYARAFELLVLGEIFTAERAREAGLVNAIVPVDDLEAHVLGIAARLARKPPEALATAKRLLRGDGAAVLERTRTEAAEFARCLTSLEARAAFEAFFTRARGGKSEQ